MGGVFSGAIMKKMVHPKHGTHFAYSEIEEADCIKNGWSYYVKAPQAEAPKILHLGKKGVKHGNSKHNNL